MNTSQPFSAKQTVASVSKEDTGTINVIVSREEFDVPSTSSLATSIGLRCITACGAFTSDYNHSVSLKDERVKVVHRLFQEVLREVVEQHLKRTSELREHSKKHDLSITDGAFRQIVETLKEFKEVTDNRVSVSHKKKGSLVDADSKLSPSQKRAKKYQKASMHMHKTCLDILGSNEPCKRLIKTLSDNPHTRIPSLVTKKSLNVITNGSKVVTFSIPITSMTTWLFTEDIEKDVFTESAHNIAKNAIYINAFTDVFKAIDDFQKRYIFSIAEEQPDLKVRLVSSKPDFDSSCLVPETLVTKGRSIGLEAVISINVDAPLLYGNLIPSHDCLSDRYLLCGLDTYSRLTHAQCIGEDVIQPTNVVSALSTASIHALDGEDTTLEQAKEKFDKCWSYPKKLHHCNVWTLNNTAEFLSMFMTSKYSMIFGNMVGKCITGQGETEALIQENVESLLVRCHYAFTYCVFSTELKGLLSEESMTYFKEWIAVVVGHKWDGETPVSDRTMEMIAHEDNQKAVINLVAETLYPIPHDERVVILEKVLQTTDALPAFQTTYQHASTIKLGFITYVNEQYVAFHKHMHRMDTIISDGAYNQEKECYTGISPIKLFQCMMTFFSFNYENVEENSVLRKCIAPIFDDYRSYLVRVKQKEEEKEDLKLNCAATPADAPDSGSNQT